jgi:glutaminase
MNSRKLFAIIFFLLGGLFTVYSQTKTIYQKLNESAIKINKTMPQILDQYSEVDSLKAMYPDTLQYYCKLLHVNKTSESISRIKQILENKMLNTVRTDPVFQPYRENKIKIVYRYYDEKKVLFFVIYLTPEKYLH